MYRKLETVNRTALRPPLVHFTRGWKNVVLGVGDAVAWEGVSRNGSSSSSRGEELISLGPCLRHDLGRALLERKKKWGIEEEARP